MVVTDWKPVRPGPYKESQYNAGQRGEHAQLHVEAGHLGQDGDWDEYSAGMNFHLLLHIVLLLGVVVNVAADCLVVAKVMADLKPVRFFPPPLFPHLGYDQILAYDALQTPCEGLVLGKEY